MTFQYYIIYMGDKMSFFDTIILDSISILFPLIVVLILKAYYKNIGKVSNNNLLDVASISSLFLLIKFYNPSVPYDILLVNMPLVISILYNRKYTVVIISVILIIFNTLNGSNIIMSILEYFYYIFIFVILTKRCKSQESVFLTFTCIKGAFMSAEEYFIAESINFSSIFKIFISLTVFYLIGTITIKIISRIEKTFSLNQTLKELEKEKNLKNSLFKITHEVKNPLAVCKGYLSMIDYNDAKKTKKYSEIILGEIDRALDIMDNFSEYTKISIRKDIMDLDFLISDTINSLNPIFKNKDIITTYNSEDEIYINGDYKRLKQVLINIMKNSVEAISKDGTINVKLKKNNKYIIIEIKDNGCGISKEDIDKIGALFYSSKQKGCGLGVALSKEIISLHSGELLYESSKGKYTKAIIKLPYEKSLQV